MVQPLCDLGLAGRGPLWSELDRVSSPGAVWGRLALYSRRQSSMITRASRRESKRHELSSFVTEPAIERLDEGVLSR